MRGIRAWVCAFVVVAACCGARAQELIADLVPAEQVRRAVQAGTAELFVEAVGASKDQEEAAEAIVSGARAAVQREVNRHLRQIRTGVDTVEAGYASEAQMVKAVRDIERNMVEDLQALTGAGQEAGFERFERDRRRGALLRVRVKRWFEQHRGSSGELFFGSDETPPTVREVLQLELTQEQRKAVLDRLAKFDASYLEMLRAWTAKVDEEVLSGTRGNAHNQILEPRDELRKVLEKDVLAMLTDAQRQAYDVSPLMEKMGHWDVEEER